MVVLTIVSVSLLMGVALLIGAGFREGDKPQDALVLNVEAHPDQRAARAEVRNPGAGSVIVGMSLRSPGLRIRLEGGAYARLRTRSSTRDLLPTEQTVIAVIDAGESQRFVIPADASVGRRAELVVVTGQSGRLRTIHREIRLALVRCIEEVTPAAEVREGNRRLRSSSP